MTGRRLRASARPGFSLIELLVVLGIISLLISLLLPVLTKVRQSSITRQCADNMRTLGMAVQMYSNDNKGWAPRAAPAWSGNSKLVGPCNGHAFDDYLWWQTTPFFLALDKSALAPYLGVPKNPPIGVEFGIGTPYYGCESANPRSPGSEKLQKIFRCPADVGRESMPQKYPEREAQFGGFHYSYTMNSHFNDLAQGVVVENPEGFDAGAPGQSRYKFTQVRRPEQKLLMGEEEYPDDGFWIVGDRDPRAPGTLTTRHQGKANVLFCDGHVDLHDWHWIDDNPVVRASLFSDSGVSPNYRPN